LDDTRCCVLENDRNRAVVYTPCCVLKQEGNTTEGDTMFCVETEEKQSGGRYRVLCS